MNRCAKWCLAILLLSFFLFLIWKGIGKFSSVFVNANDSIQAASIAAIGSVIILLIGRFFEQRRDAKQRINIEKIEIYKGFFDFYFDLMSYEKIHGSPKPQEKILQEMFEFQKQIVFWGSDSVVRAYLDFKETMISFNDEIGKEPDELHEKVAKTLKSVANVLISMRRDVGYSFTSLTPSDLARLQLSNDTETLKIYDHL